MMMYSLDKCVQVWFAASLPLKWRERELKLFFYFTFINDAVLFFVSLNYLSYAVAFDVDAVDAIVAAAAHLNWRWT